MLKPALRLTWRLAPYTLYSFVILLMVLLMYIVILTIGIQGLSIITLIGAIYSVYVWKLITSSLGGQVVVKELKERAGKPIKVFRPGKKNYRFMDKLGWGYETKDCYIVFVNPRTDKFSFTKYLYLLDPDSKDFSNQLLEVAATNEKAFEEISSKVQSGKWRASSDLRKFEDATAVSNAIADIMK